MKVNVSVNIWQLRQMKTVEFSVEVFVIFLLKSI